MKIAIVTGASSGLGAEFARTLSSFYSVDRIWLVARRKDRLEKLAKEIGNGVVIEADLSTSSGLATIESTLAKEKPDVKVLINNAGFGKHGLFSELSLKDNQGMIDVNISALVRLTHSCLPFISSGGVVIQVASSAGFVPLPFSSVYSATKAFVVNFSYALAPSLRKRGISVTAVCPGPVKTEFFDVFSEGRNAVSGPMASASAVVRKAFRDASRGKLISVYGIFFGLVVFMTKLIPLSFIVNRMFNAEWRSRERWLKKKR
ncbi:MAG: SDR family NAD(P)-dependent oxidoreductase [Nanoarchaeota archaeon]|nr:SDR family NAD(P)-dependent oxidoreductase [Nanoarchaeota archaeon]